MKTLFDRPVVEWWRRFPVIMPGINPVEPIRKLIKEVFQGFQFPLEIVYELMRICFAAGFIKGDQEVPYDGSEISHVASHLKSSEGRQEAIFLSDLHRLRSSHALSFEEFIDLALKFFSANEEIFRLFPSDRFSEKYPYGVFRLESLYSLFGVESMTLSEYLHYLAANFWAKKRIFEQWFPLVHRSSFVPVDHLEGYNTFRYHGPFTYLGDIQVKGSTKKVFLVIAPGVGEGYMGVRLALAIEHPSAAVFDISVDKRQHGNGFFPTVLKIQRSPYQLDKELRFSMGFIDHHDFPTNNTQVAVQEAISEQLLGGGDVFYSLLLSLATLYSDLGYPILCGWPGDENRWLKYHDNRPGAAEEVYDSKYRALGFEQNSSLWKAGLNGDYTRMLERATEFRKLEQCQCITVNRDFGDRCQPVVVSLPRYQQRVSETGLARLVEGIYQMLLHLQPQVSGVTMAETLHVFRQARWEAARIYAECERIKLAAQNPPPKVEKKKKKKAA